MKYSSDSGGIPAVRRSRGPAAVLFGALGAATYIAALQVYPAPAQTTSRSPASQDVEYAASETCAVCHRKIWETYRQTGMGRSFYRPSAANTVGNDTPQTFYHKPSEQLLHDAPAGRQILPAAPPGRLRRPADQRDGEADRLRHGVRQPRAHVSAPDGPQHACRAAARLVRRKGRLLGDEPGIRPARSRRLPPQDHLRLHVLPQRISEDPGGERPAVCGIRI